MVRNLLALCSLLPSSFAVIATAQAGDGSASQAYQVVVPTSATVASPSGQVQLVHDESNGNQQFEPQLWTVRGNTEAGVTVSFETSSPFVHVDQPTSRRDVELELAVASTAGAASWDVTTPSGRSDYARGQAGAVVSAVSNGVGRADLSLTVNFITGSFGTFATGDYVTTVVGTVTPQ